MATFNGTEGNDTITGGADADLINGNAGNDSLLGGDGSDTVTGGAGNDFVSGNTGTDWVEGGAGNDEVRGGSGQDSIAVHEFGVANADQLTDFDAGWDNIQLDAAAFAQIGAVGRMAAGDARFYSAPGAIGGHDADDRIVYNSTTGQLYYDADGSGGGAAQLIATITNHSALAPTDVWVFGNAAPSQTVNGTSGNDTLIGGDGPDTLNGFAGDDSLFGGAGADQLNGGDGNDTLDGTHKTHLTPDPDVDTMEGGAGNDTYYVDNASDVLVDSSGVDTVISLLFQWTLGPGFENLTMRPDDEGGHGIGNELDNVIDGSVVGRGILEGLAGNDVLISGTGANTLLGGEGNDTIRARSADTVDGGNGNDVIYSGPFAGSPPTLAGGAGADTFIFAAAPTNQSSGTHVVDFASALDRIELDARAMPALGADGSFSSNDARFYAAPGAT